MCGLVFMAMEEEFSFLFLFLFPPFRGMKPV